jgi:AraC-like DNA-binding protein
MGYAMKQEDNIYRVPSITDLHHIAGFGKPRHPLISVMDYAKVVPVDAPESGRFVCEFYAVNFKKHCSFRYGRQFFDHQEGTLLCTAPEQVVTMEKSDTAFRAEGWGLFFHPELIRNTALGKRIGEYTFFRYDECEALHLADHEQQTLTAILQQIEAEYHTALDAHSHGILISNLELLLNYCQRYYGRQFITRTTHHKDILARFEQYLTQYIHSGALQEWGLPTVKSCAGHMNLSPNYFSDLLKNETGKNAQEHIHYYVLDRAKTLLLSTDQTVNEIAYALGFEYPQSLTKLFKNKTGLTPTEYRRSQPFQN